MITDSNFYNATLRINDFEYILKYIRNHYSSNTNSDFEYTLKYIRNH